jgi:glycosyltransferase involved in cell wall biosynthesis
MSDTPLVSCLTVTQCTWLRFAFLKNAIGDYCRQTHAARELVIVLDSGPAETRQAILDHVAGLGRDDIRIVEGRPGAALGALRNQSAAAARGAVLCQWDDDDRHHPERIAGQLKALIDSQNEAVCLQELMQYFPATRSLYCTNWRATEHGSMPGTLMFRASARVPYPETGDTARLAEDSAVHRAYSQRKAMGALAGAPHLYVYVSHGANSWHQGHHRMLADELGISAGLLRRREAAIREGLSVFDFGPEPVSVVGPSGLAFILNP